MPAQPESAPDRRHARRSGGSTASAGVKASGATTSARRSSPAPAAPSTRQTPPRDAKPPDDAKPAGQAGERPSRVRKRAAEHPAAAMGAYTLVAVALAIPLVTLAMVVMTRVQYESTRRGQFDHIRAEAQAQYDAATSSADPTTMRAGLTEALATIDQGLSLNPNDDVLLSLQRRIQHYLDEANTVQRLFHFWQLAELDEPLDTPAGSGRIVLHERDVFLLNRGSDRVYRFRLNEVGDALEPQDTEPTLIAKDELRDGIQVGQMVDIAWVEAGGQRSLSTFMALESNGSLLAYDPQQGIDVLPVADSDKWLKPAAIGGYFGNLYVLEPLQSRILKYVPVDNAYTASPSDYLDPRLGVDLTGAVDLAIDGNMYVLLADGTVKKFYDGVEQAFSLSGLPDPMRSPTTLFVSGEQKPDAPGYLYVADAGNERVLQFDKGGAFVRQFMAQPGAPQFRGLRGIYVDEEQRRLYVLSGRTLWLADLPALGA